MSENDINIHIYIKLLFTQNFMKPVKCRTYKCVVVPSKTYKVRLKVLMLNIRKSCKNLTAQTHSL